MAKDKKTAPETGADGGALSSPPSNPPPSIEGEPEEFLTPEPVIASAPSLDELRAAVNPQAWAHAAASALHGWKEHFYHEGKPISLTEDDYRAALDAALTGSGDAPHPKALSPHRGKGY